MSLNVEDKLFEIAGDIGKVKEAVGSIKNDVNVLFDQNRSIKEDMAEHHDKIVIIEANIAARQNRLFSLSAIVMFIKKWIGMGGGY